MITFLDLMSAIRHRIALVALVGFSVFALVMIIALRIPREYAASSSVLVDLAQPDPTRRDKAADANVSVIDSIIGTQVDILRSNAVLDPVAEQSPQFKTSRYGSTVERRHEAALKDLREHLAIVSEKGSNVIRLSYSDRSPQTAADTMNRIVATFLAKQVQLRIEPARRDAKWFDAQTREARGRLEAALQRLSAFQRQHGMVGTDRMDIEADRARSLSTQLVAAQAAAAEAHSRATSGAVPEVVQSDVSQNVERDLSAQEARVAELAKTLGPNHPDMLAARARLDALQQALHQARGTQQSALTSAGNAAAQREGTIRAQLAEQQNRLISMSGAQDQANVLQRDVDVAKQNYDDVRKRLNDATLSSKVSQSSATLLDRATPPNLPYKPNLVLFAAAGLVLGLVSGLLAGIARELMQPRVRTPSGAARALDLDVIADMAGHDGWANSWRAPSRMGVAA